MDTASLSVRVAGRIELARDIIGFTLVDPAGGLLPAYEPGAHIDVHLPGGYIRQYSLSGDARQTRQYDIAVLREPESRGGSVAAFDRVRVGDILPISAPRNRFALMHATRSLLFAGGIGITPLFSMARALHAQKAGFELHYSCREPARMAYRDALQGMLSPGQLFLYFDQAEPPDVAGRPDIPAILRSAERDVQIYICGPAGYIEWVQGQARAAGVVESRIRCERFALDAADRPVLTDEDVAFEVELASTGEIFQIPADESITSALDRQGVYIPVSCEEGICGTCLTGVCSGTPDHRDTYLTDEEHEANDQFTPCVSRALTPRLVLDL
ncbi:2Fe-2S iron-sulfur cluster-binding protein [Castellaniella sp.]|uniref:PDR/VanB family oxidoreductase n=1 Tax=Castellaniella sp. TaxID=1955812 RepID=UPI0035611878